MEELTLLIDTVDELELYDNEIIPIYQVTDTGEKVVDGRELHEYLGVVTPFRKWVKRRIKDYGFEEGLDFSPFLSESNGGRPSKEYVFTLDAGKELGMVEKNNEGKRIRRYFIEIEKRARGLSEKDKIRIRGIEARRGFTDALQESGENERMKGHAYSTYTNMIYKLVLGMNSRQYKKLNGIEGNLRDALNSGQLDLIKTLESVAKGMLDLGLEYKQIKKAIQDTFALYVEKLDM